MSEPTNAETVNAPTEPPMERRFTVEFSALELAVTLGMMGLGVAVMQNDEENGRVFIASLSQDGVEAVCKAVLERFEQVRATL